MDGSLKYVGEVENGIHEFQAEGEVGPANDHVLIAVDAAKNYICKEQLSL